jgi:hypothetical protein
VPSSPTVEYVQRLAEYLAQEHGLDAERLRRLLERLAAAASGPPLQSETAGEHSQRGGLGFVDAVNEVLRRSSGDHGFLPCFSEAMQHLPAEQATTLFESTAPLALWQRSTLLRCFLDPSFPFYALDELADLIEEYVRYRERSRDLLMETGYPNQSFARSAWLDGLLTPVYPVKLPVSVYKSPADPELIVQFEAQGLLPTDDEGNRLYRYLWTKQEGVLWWSGSPTITRGLDVNEPLDLEQLCPYSDAALLYGMPEKTARTLDECRPRFVQLQLDVLHICLRCLRSRDASSLWPDALTALTRALSADVVREQLRVCAIYERLPLGEQLAWRFGRSVRPHLAGGLSDLLVLAGHIEKELRLGTIGETKRVLTRHQPDLAELQSYFQVVGKPVQGQIDAVLHGFLSFGARDKAFWEEFTQRVNDAIQEEFDQEEVGLSVRLKPDLGQKFQMILLPFWEAEVRNLQETGEALSLRYQTPDAQRTAGVKSGWPPAVGNVFRQRGKGWHLQFGSSADAIWLPDAKGLGYIHRLLELRGETISALDLQRTSHGTAAGPADHPYARLTAEQLEEEGLSVAGPEGTSPSRSSSDRKESRRDLAEAKKGLETAKRQLEEALQRGDTRRAPVLAETVHGLEREIRRTEGHHGSPRNDHEPRQKARKAVGNRIRAALVAISKHHQALGDHLRAHLDLGEDLRYESDHSVRWVL